MLFMMWYDDSKLTLLQKATDGIAHYKERFHVEPNIVQFNIEQLRESPVEIKGMLIQGINEVRPNIIRIGIKEVSDDDSNQQ
jgi:hypothetical protein